MTRSPLDVPCTPCGVSAGRYCDGAEPCAERVAKAGEVDAQADAVRARDAALLERVKVWLRAQADRHEGDGGGGTVLRSFALHLAADELSLEVLP